MTGQRRLMRIGWLRPGYLTLAVMVVFAFTGCGPRGAGSDNPKPTSTSATIAQPTATGDGSTAVATVADSIETQTSAATSPPTGIGTTQSIAGGTPTESSSTSRFENSGRRSMATPVVAETTAQEDDRATGTGTVFTGSDGTSGATPISVPRTVEIVATPEPVGGTPDSAPGLAILEETRVIGPIEFRAMEPISVNSCSPENVPLLLDDGVSYTTNATVNFRRGPGKDCRSIGNGPLGMGVVVRVTSPPVNRVGDGNIWIQIRVNDIVGWIVLDSIEPT